MNILYLASSSDWHVDLWVKYFSNSHSVYLFSDKEDYLKTQPFDNVTMIHSNGYFGKILNFFKCKSHLLFQINKLISVRKFARHVDRQIKKYDIDIVHAHSLYHGFIASYMTSNIPVVFTPMGSDVIIHAQKKPVYKYMALKAYNKAQVITGDSLLKQKRGYKLGARKEKNYIIQNGVDSSIFFPKKNSLKLQYGISNDEVLLFSPRAITSLYNIDVIIASLVQVKNSGHKIKCMFSYAFGNEYSDKLRRQVSDLSLDDNVIWLGTLTYKEMADHYNASDIVISIPSSDSSPKSVYEAMFCRKPIIISDLEWSYELLSNCNCLLRVQVRNEEMLAKAILKIIEDREYASMIAKNSFNIARRYYDYKENMEDMEVIMLNEVGYTGMGNEES